MKIFQYEPRFLKGEPLILDDDTTARLVAQMEAKAQSNLVSGEDRHAAELATQQGLAYIVSCVWVSGCTRYRQCVITGRRSSATVH